MECTELYNTDYWTEIPRLIHLNFALDIRGFGFSNKVRGPW